MLAPAFATDNAADLILADSVLVSERLLADATLSIPPSNVYNLGVGDLRVGVQPPTDVTPLAAQATLHRGVMHIGPLIAEEQMAGLTAGRVVALVQDEHSLGDRAEVEFPRNAMDADSPASLGSLSQDPVTLDGSATPTPAGLGLHNLVPVAFGQRPSHANHYSRMDG